MQAGSSGGLTDAGWLQHAYGTAEVLRLTDVEQPAPGPLAGAAALSIFGARGGRAPSCVRIPPVRGSAHGYGVGMLDFECCYRAILSRDPRFDGWFFTAVATTGIYCRPSCPAPTPKKQNVRFFPTSAAAHNAGFRACRRCRPDATPGSPEWNCRDDLVGRAMRLIADGVVDRGGVSQLADRLHYSERHLNRLLTAEVGAGPIALARAQRARTARILLENTDLPVTTVAFAAGFASVRQFNDTVKSVFSCTPSALRGSRPLTAPGNKEGPLNLRLPYRKPLHAESLFRFLALRAVPGIESGNECSYRRTLTLPHGSGSVELRNEQGHIGCSLVLPDLKDLTTAIHRCRRMLDLDADPCAVDEQLGSDPFVGALVTRRPGLRSPGHVDPAEAAIRAVLGQQVSVASARAAAARIAMRYGKMLPGSERSPVPEAPGPPSEAGPGRVQPTPGQTPLARLFPGADILAEVDPATLPVTRSRARTVVALAEALASGRIVLGLGADREEVKSQLESLPGIGPWTAAYIRLRALGDPDVFMPSDLGIRKALELLGTGSQEASGARFRPWRSYALHHLWASLAGERIST
ncbi:MAG: DNA-3-methyladenine glycosylase 2 family protein [Actinomycetota bacterium]